MTAKLQRRAPQAAKTVVRAEATPVSKATKTNMSWGTLNNADTYKVISDACWFRGHITYSRPMPVGHKVAANEANSGIIHASARFKGAERPESGVLALPRDGREECKAAEGAQPDDYLEMEGDGLLIRGWGSVDCCRTI